MDGLKLGVVPIKRGFLSMEEALRQKNAAMETIRALCGNRAHIIDIDSECPGGIASDADAAQRAVAKLRAAGVDALFLLFCDFGEETVAARVASELTLPTLVWGPRDERPNTYAARGRDTQCGILAATKVLARRGVRYSYIVSCPAQSADFARGFLRFLGAANAVKTLRTVRIAKFGGRPEPFLSVLANEAQLLERFGVECVPISLASVASRAQKLIDARDEALIGYIAEFSARVNCANTDLSELERMLAVKLAMEELMRLNGCAVAATECWSNMAELLGVLPCLAIGELTGAGLPVACEGDLNGAVTLALLNACALGEGPQFFADLTIRHPQNDNAELLWHCGSFPYALKDPASPARVNDMNGCWELKRGAITVCRFDELNGEYSIFAGEGRATTGPETTGTFVWLEVDSWPAWEETLAFGPYIHHVGGTYGQYQAALREAAYFLGVRFDEPGSGARRAL